MATVDETPIGVFLELEGLPRWVDRIARVLGFSAADYITLSYGRLYIEACAARGIAPTNMVFDRPKKR
jgi:adenylate cyclase, class 2